ncbi:MAG: hypothetical protein DLM72_00540 [Candidatus Nitrosopolaris wilkensis]|nr:MAG: hypothetical protein DLM72_00540 [Candidatus Nitrosopolaris wilkensis]
MSKPICEGPAYSIMVNSLRSPKTKTEYSRYLTAFADWKDVKSLDDLLVNDNEKLVKSDIMKYLLFLKDEKQLSSSTRSGVLSAIKHFYEMNDITLPWLQLQKFIGEHETVTEDRAYIYEEIQILLGIADIKYKAIILLMCSSAIRVGFIHSLKVGHLNKIPIHNIYKISVYKKSRQEYYTFCSPECYNAINAYLSHRKAIGEGITPDSPLFRIDQQTDIELIKDAQPLTYSAVKSRLRLLLLRSGLAKRHPINENNKNGRRRNEVASAHGYRKFAITQMGRAKMDGEIREMLAGHKKWNYVYLKYSEEDLLQEYLKAVNLLTINEENRLKVKVNELEQKNLEIAQLKQQMEEMQEAKRDEENEIDELAKKFERMEAYFNNKLDK